jgi:uncharacterized DUF497 family protein
MKVRWDPRKAESNWRKHGVTFFEGESLFYNPLAVSITDHEHSLEEDRFVMIGESRNYRVIVVTYTVSDDEARIISVRRANSAEKKRYMRGDEIRDKEVDDTEDDTREYDFTNGIRGRHYIPMTITRVSIYDDVAQYFHDDETVNTALRELIAEGRVPQRRNE